MLRIIRYVKIKSNMYILIPSTISTKGRNERFSCYFCFILILKFSSVTKVLLMAGFSKYSDGNSKNIILNICYSEYILIYRGLCFC